MNEVHLSGLIQSVWQYEGDTFVRIHIDRHRHSLGGRRQDQIAVRVPPHVVARTPLETGRHLSFHGYLEPAANGTVEEDLRRRLRRGGRRGPDAIERLINDTPALIRRLPAREEQRIVAERIEDPPSPRRGRTPNQNNRRADPARPPNPNPRRATPPAPAVPAAARAEPRAASQIPGDTEPVGTASEGMSGEPPGDSAPAPASEAAGAHETADPDLPPGDRIDDGNDD